MKEKHTKEIYISKKESKLYQDLMFKTGKEIYDKYGYKRDEIFTHTANFGNGVEMDIKMVLCGEDDTPYIEAVLFQNGHEVTHSDAAGYSVLGCWTLSDENTEYIVQVREEETEETKKIVFLKQEFARNLEVIDPDCLTTDAMRTREKDGCLDYDDVKWYEVDDLDIAQSGCFRVFLGVLTGKDHADILEKAMEEYGYPGECYEFLEV